jgi:hypothetical protein
LDIEPNIEELKALSHGGARRLTPTLIHRILSIGAFVPLKMRTRRSSSETRVRLTRGGLPTLFDG